MAVRPSCGCGPPGWAVPRRTGTPAIRARPCWPGTRSAGRAPSARSCPSASMTAVTRQSLLAALSSTARVLLERLPLDIQLAWSASTQSGSPALTCCPFVTFSSSIWSSRGAVCLVGLALVVNCSGTETVSAAQERPLGHDLIDLRGRQPVQQQSLPLGAEDAFEFLLLVLAFQQGLARDGPVLRRPFPGGRSRAAPRPVPRRCAGTPPGPRPLPRASAAGRTAADRESPSRPAAARSASPRRSAARRPAWPTGPAARRPSPAP